MKTLRQEIQDLYKIANVKGDTLDIFSLAVKKLLLEDTVIKK